MEVKILNLVSVEIAAKFFGKQREYTFIDKRIVIECNVQKGSNQLYGLRAHLRSRRVKKRVRYFTFWHSRKRQVFESAERCFIFSAFLRSH
jgi:hypothetical protein